MNWQHVNILAATNYLRECMASGAPDARAKDLYEGLLDVLDPSRREAQLKREVAAAKAALAPPPATPARRRRARPAPPAKRPRR